jgi:hypothetical protein
VRKYSDLEVLRICRLVPLLAAKQIDRNPASDRIQPRRRIPLRIKTRRCAPCLEERLLNCLLGKTPVPQSAISNREHGPAILLVQVADGSGITIPKPSHHTGTYSLAHET